MCLSQGMQNCKACKYLEIKPCSLRKRLFNKLVLSYKDEILHTTEVLLVDKKVTCEKSNYLIYIVSFVIICLLLFVVISTTCYYYYRKHYTKNKIHCKYITLLWIIHITELI